MLHLMRTVRDRRIEQLQHKNSLLERMQRARRHASRQTPVHHPARVPTASTAVTHTLTRASCPVLDVHVDVPPCSDLAQRSFRSSRRRPKFSLETVRTQETVATRCARRCYD